MKYCKQILFVTLLFEYIYKKLYQYFYILEDTCNGV